MKQYDVKLTYGSIDTICMALELYCRTTLECLKANMVNVQDNEKELLCVHLLNEFNDLKNAIEEGAI